jgi:hypothetical protein
VASEVSLLLLVNAGYFLVGFAGLAALGWVTQERATWYRIGVAYPLGLGLVVIPASYLALLGLPVGQTAVGVSVVVGIAAAVRVGLWRRGSERVSRAVRSRPTAGGVVGAGLGVVLAVLLVYAARTFATRPILEWDSWAIWMTKARLLYADPALAPALLRSGNYGQAPYPLGLPTLEALGFSAMGQFDGTVIGLQFLLLACAFPLALWSILRARARPWMIALVSLAIVGAPQILFQLMTKYADVPLGLFVGLGVAGGAAWAVSPENERWLLGCFVAFLGLAAVTKSEGFLFALAGIVALIAATLVMRSTRRVAEAAVASGALLVVMIPWRVYCSVHGLTTPDYNLSNAASPSYLRAHADRVGPAAHELWRQLTNTSSWGLLAWVILLAVVVGAAGAKWHLLAFAGIWLVLAAGGLLVTYWISVLPVSSHLTNSSYRTIVSLLVGGAAMVPLFVFPRPAPAESETA